MALKFQGSIFNCVSGTDKTAVGEVTSIGGPSGQANIIDVTHSLSAAVEKLMGLPDEGQVTLGLNLVLGDGGQDELLNRRQAQSEDSYDIEFPDAASTVWSFQGFCTGFSVDGSANEKWGATANVEVTGQVTRV